MIRRLLTPPYFEDEEQNRQAGILNALLWPILAVTGVLGCVLAVSRAGGLIVTIVAGMSLLWLTSILLMHRGHVSFAGFLFIYAGWAVMIASALLQDGLTSPFIWFIFVILLLSNLLLKPNQIRVLAVLSVVAVVLIIINEREAFIPQLLTTPNLLRRSLSLTAAIVLTTIISQLAMGDLRRALRTGQADRKRLQDANRLLEETQAVLEHRVTERTAALEIRAQQLQAAAEVASSVASIRDLDQLLYEITGLISERFNYYHVGIYLLDDPGANLVLKAANTRIGRELIVAGFNLPLDAPSMAAGTAMTRQPRVAADVHTDDQYRALDELSLTQSEITLPLITGDSLLGVLDLQDTTVRTPTSDELATLKILANQISIAIENAKLFASSQKSYESLQRAYGTMSREGWQKVLRSEREIGYQAAASGSPKPAGGEWKPEMVAAQASGEVIQADPHTLAIPIKIRDQVTGVVRLRKPDDADGWMADEVSLVQTLSDRLSTALESARLYEETRRRAERERLTGEITARMRASNDPQEILKAAASELRKALQADRAQLMVHYETEVGSQANSSQE